MSRYALFLDDERYPAGERGLRRLWNGLRRFVGHPSPDGPNGLPWLIARDYAQAVAIVERLGTPAHISFDHDLGRGPSGMAFANWLVDYLIDRDVGIPFTFYRTWASAPARPRQRLDGGECAMRVSAY